MSNAVALRQDNAVATSDLSAKAIEDVLIRGNLKDLTEEQRLVYYRRVCESTGLNPLTQPFSYLELDGRLVLYAKRDAADQLRKINGISIEIVDKKISNGLISVHVRATDKDGRKDEDLGVVALPNKDSAAANAILKAITKAKRRVTLSISGLGFLDETEVEDIESNNKRPVETGAIENPPRVSLVHSAPAETVAETGGTKHDAATGEVVEGPRAIALTKDAGNKDDWMAWSARFLDAVNAAKTDAEIAGWIGANKDTLGLLEKASPKFYDRLSARTSQARDALATKPLAGADKAEGEGIPGFLDRTNETTADQEFVDGIDAEFSKAATMAELDAAWQAKEAAVINQTRAARDAVAECYEAHVRRIKNEA